MRGHKEGKLGKETRRQKPGLSTTTTKSIINNNRKGNKEKQ